MPMIDRLIGLISPAAEARRIRARIAVGQLRQLDARLSRRGYDGAKKGRRTDGWVTSAGSADSATRAGLTTLRERSRDLVRNNPWAERGVRVIAANTVGCGIIPQAKTSSTKRTAQWETAWRAWADTTACDADGLHDFYGLQSLVVRSVVQDGEVLVRRYWRRAAEGLPVPVQLQVLEADYLDTTKDGIALAGGGRIIQGVEFDASGRRVAYWLFDQHPGSVVFGRGGFASRRIAASEIAHIFRADRPGQVRGVPWLAPVIIRLKDLDDYEDAQLVRQKVAACFTAFIHDMEGLDEADSADDKTEKFGRVQPGQIEILPPGKDITFGTPPAAEGYGEHTRALLRSIAAAFGTTYEGLTGDLSQVNFSSARMGWLEFHRNVRQWQDQLIVGRLCRQVQRWFEDAAETGGAAVGPVDTVWTPPRREMIDPVSETKAIRDKIRAGLSTLSEEIRALGRDPAEVLDEMQTDLAALDARGIVLDVDGRQRTAAGGAVSTPASTDDAEDAAAGGEKATA